jgi:hypothetical protein
MAPRNQTKKVRSVEERYLRADFKEATKNAKKKKTEQTSEDKRIAELKARLQKLSEAEAESEPIHQAKSEAVPEPIHQANPEVVPEPIHEAKAAPKPEDNPDVIVID